MAVQTAPSAVTIGGRPPKRRGRLTPNLPLIRARHRKQLSRADLAAMTGLSEKQIGYIERGVVRNPRMATCAAIADAVEEDMLALFPVEGRFR